MQWLTTTLLHLNLFSPEPTLIAKSSLLLDVKPWDDETDMAKLEECVRSIQADGLVWGSCKSWIEVTRKTWQLLLVNFEGI